MTRPVIFSGPSLPRALVEAAGLRWRPPVRRGDVRAALADRPKAIGIVDGVFESVPTVAHDEILEALDGGIPVYGAASIGALRATELDVHGMIGVGEIYAQYRDGVLEDDDEVALLHAPEELGFRALTLPMVNIRATVADARLKGFTTPASAGIILERCKAMFYKTRSVFEVQRVTEDHFLSNGWLSSVDRKGLDAKSLLYMIARSTHRHDRNLGGEQC